MNRVLAGVLLALALLLPVVARAQNPGAQGPLQYSNSCATQPRYGMAYLCLDTSSGTIYIWGTTSFIATSPTFTNIKASKICANNTVANGCTTNAVAGDIGATNATGGGQYWFGTGNNASLDYGVSSAGKFTLAGPTAGGLYITPPSDETLNLTNGGHYSSTIGGGVAPTVGTGSMTAGSTDTALSTSGATSPATVTFGVQFHAAPVCVCSDNTTPANGCKVVPAVGSAVVTTAGTDSFSMICMGK